MQRPQADRSPECGRSVGVENQRSCRRKREADPGAERAQVARAHQTDGESKLTACGTGKELAQRHEIGKGLLAEPAAAYHEFLVEIADVGDRSTETGDTQPQEGPQDPERRTATLSRKFPSRADHEFDAIRPVRLGLPARVSAFGCARLDFMAEMQGRAELEAEKRCKFRALVRHAAANSPYYAKLIREREIDLAACGPEDFPVLTKSLLMANFDEIVTDRRITKRAVAEFLTRSTNPAELLFDDITVMHTSGTSGEVGYFLHAPADYARMRRGARRNFAAYRGRFPLPWLRFRRIRVAFYGATGGHFAGVTGVASMQRGLGRLLLNAQAFEVNTPLPQVVEQLNGFKPDVLFGYTMALKMLGEEQRAGRLNIRPGAVAATGETATRGI